MVTLARRVLYWSVLIPVLGLATCAPVTKLVPVCVDQYSYTDRQMMDLGDEIEAHGYEVPAMVNMIGNYSDIRHENEVCRRAQARFFNRWHETPPSIAAMDANYNN